MNSRPYKPESETDVDGFIAAFQLGEVNEPLPGYTNLAKPLANGSIDYKLHHALSRIEEKRASLWQIEGRSERTQTGFALAVYVKFSNLICSAHPQYWRDREKASELADSALNILESAIEILNSEPIPDILTLKKLGIPVLSADPQNQIDKIRNWLEAIRPDQQLLVGRNSKNMHGVSARDRNIAVRISDFLTFQIADGCASEVAVIVSHLVKKTIRTKDVDDWLRKRPNKDPDLES